MKKAVSVSLIAVILLVIVGAFFLFSSKNPSSSQQLDSKTYDISSLILSISDFPQGENWTLKDRGERGKTDVTNNSILLGWQGGYMASYLRGNPLESSGSLDWSRVDIALSVYPKENISKVLDIPFDTPGVNYDKLSDPNIGDDSVAYKATYVDQAGMAHVDYEIDFVKGTIYYYLYIQGTRVDYELLKSLARKAADKI
jgi:hypothetical protein